MRENNRPVAVHLKNGNVLVYPTVLKACHVTGISEYMMYYSLNNYPGTISNQGFGVRDAATVGEWQEDSNYITKIDEVILENLSKFPTSVTAKDVSGISVPSDPYTSRKYHDILSYKNIITDELVLNADIYDVGKVIKLHPRLIKEGLAKGQVQFTDFVVYRSVTLPDGFVWPVLTDLQKLACRRQWHRVVQVKVLTTGEVKHYKDSKTAAAHIHLSATSVHVHATRGSDIDGYAFKYIIVPMPWEGCPSTKLRPAAPITTADFNRILFNM